MNNLNNLRRKSQKHLIQSVDVIHDVVTDDPNKIPSSEVTNEIETTKAEAGHRHDSDYLLIKNKATDVSDEDNDILYITPSFLKRTLATFLGKAKTITGVWTFRALEVVSGGNVPIYMLLSGASVDTVTDIIGGITVTDRAKGKTRQLTFHNDGSVRYQGVKFGLTGDFLPSDGTADNSLLLDGLEQSVDNVGDTVVTRNKNGRINVTDLIMSKTVESGGIVGEETIALVGGDGVLKHYSKSSLKLWIGTANSTDKGLVKLVTTLGTSNDSTLTQKALNDLFENLNSQYLGVKDNAVSATKLKTGRKINGKTFDGTGDITTDVWGHGRTFTFGDSSKSVDGSSDVSFSLVELGAVSTEDGRLTNSREWTAELVSKVESEAGTSVTPRKWSAERVRQAIDSVVTELKLDQYLPKTGGELTGPLALTDLVIKKTIESGGVVTPHSIILLTQDGEVVHYSHTALKTWIGNATTTNPGLVKLVGDLGTATDAAVTQKLLNDVVQGLELTYLGIDDNAVSATKLKNTRKINGTDFDGTGDVTTTKWGISRTITIGDKAISVNGSGDIEYSLEQIGAVSDNDSRLTNSREWTAGIVTKEEAEAGNSNNAKKWTALRVRESINKVVTDLNLDQYFPKAGGEILGHVHSNNKGILPKRTYVESETQNDIVDGLSIFNVDSNTGTTLPFGFTGGLTVKRSYNRGWEMGVGGDLSVYVRRLHDSHTNGKSDWDRLFSVANPPTKSTVELNLVNNWSATSSLSDSATNKYATANAVYKLKEIVDTLSGGGDGGFLTETQADSLYLAKDATAKNSDKLGGVLASGYRKIIKKVIGVPKNTWQTLFKVGSHANGTVFSFTLQGTTGSTVIAIKADVMTLHPGRVVISGINADYTDVVLRVSATSGGAAYVEMYHKGAATTNMTVVVNQRDGFPVTFYTNGHTITDAVTTHRREIYLSGDYTVTSGAFNSKGNLNENGQRVFSPNNRNITDSLTNSSSSIYGSAKANKLLNDLITTNLDRSIRSDINDVVTAHTRWNDGYEARFGSNNDLRVGHNGTTSYINSYTGNLQVYNYAVGGDMHWYLKGTDNGLRVAMSLISSGNNAYVQLKFNNHVRLQTDSAGVHVTGRVTATDFFGSINTPTGNELIINAGEAKNKFTGQTAEKIYLNSEGGLEIVTPDSEHSNFQTGYTAIKTTITGYAIIVNGNTVWHAGNDGPGSGMNADLLDNHHANANSVANTIALRNRSGDLFMRLARSTYGNQTNISGAMAFRVNNAGDNYIRFCSDTNAIRGYLSLYSKAEQDTRYLKVGSKAADSNKLDNIDSSQFVRSDVTDSKTNTLQMQDNAYLKFGSGGDVEHFFNGSHYYTDLNAGMNWYLRDGNSSEATRFTFDIDSGNLQCTGNVTAYNSSDIRLKTELTDFDDPLGIVSKFRTGAYIKKNPENFNLTHWEIGLIADDIKDWCSGMVSKDQFGYLTIKDGGNEFHSLLFSCIKKLSALNEDKDNKINELVDRVELLEKSTNK